MQETRQKGREVRNLIGGRWEEGNGRATEPVYDPATGEVVAETPLSTAEDLDRAVKKAEEAFPGWVQRRSSSGRVSCFASRRCSRSTLRSFGTW